MYRRERNIVIAVGLILLIAVIAFATTRSVGSSIYPVKLGGKYGYIDHAGKLVINPQFEQAGHFSDGTAPVKVGQKWGYIDRHGKLVIQPQFDLADPFSNGRALIGSGRQFGYIDSSGRFVINPQFE